MYCILPILYSVASHSIALLNSVVRSSWYNYTAIYIYIYIIVYWKSTNKLLWMCSIRHTKFVGSSIQLFLKCNETFILNRHFSSCVNFNIDGFFQSREAYELIMNPRLLMATERKQTEMATLIFYIGKNSKSVKTVQPFF